MQDAELQKLEEDIKQKEADLREEERKDELLKRQQELDEKLRKRKMQNSGFWKFVKWVGDETADLLRPKR